MSKNPTLWSSSVEHWEIARTLRGLQIHFDAKQCTGVRQCYEVCPVGCWTPNYAQRQVEFHDPDWCIACGACVLQCPESAITLE